MLEFIMQTRQCIHLINEDGLLIDNVWIKGHWKRNCNFLNGWQKNKQDCQIYEILWSNHLAKKVQQRTFLFLILSAGYAWRLSLTEEELFVAQNCKKNCPINVTFS